MIILDTHILSELMKLSPNPNVITWLDEQQVSDLFITTITVAEINYGISALPEGKRKIFLERAFDAAVLKVFNHRIIPFDESSAVAYGKLMAQRKRLGSPLSIFDGQIAAIAFSSKATLVTRNENDFFNCGLKLINPFNLNV